MQARRLRERLTEYYLHGGSDHAIHITIPNGQYAPRFVHNSLRVATAPEAIAPFWRSRLLDRGRMIKVPEARFSSQPAANAVRILAGLTHVDHIDGSGRVWSQDRYFSGGAAFSCPEHLIFGTREQKIFRSGREGDFRYDIPLNPGVYELRLYFAETTFGDTGVAALRQARSTRSFDVLVNGQTVIHRLDVIAEAGASAANIKVIKDVSPDADGMLHLSFLAVSYRPFLNAIEITPGIPGRLRTLRMVALTHGYIDTMQNYWEPDHGYGTGGQLVRPPNQVTDVPDPGLYVGGRWGNLIYTIPVTPGRYGLRLHLAERCSKPSEGRYIDILCNGVALERKFNILKQTGSLTRGLVLPFDGLEPTYQGKLVLSLVPNPDFALISALEVVDQTTPEECQGRSKTRSLGRRERELKSFRIALQKRPARSYLLPTRESPDR